MKNILYQVQALQLKTRMETITTTEKFWDADTFADVDAAPLGEPNEDMDTDDNQL